MELLQHLLHQTRVFDLKTSPERIQTTLREVKR